MVQKIEGFRTRDGQFIADEESAIIAETMAEIISTIPELRLIADTVQANLRSLCLHTQQLAAFYAKNHPRVIRETTPEPPLDEGLYSLRCLTGHAQDLPRWNDVTERWENIDVGFPPAGVELIEPEDVLCDCSALMNGDHHHSPTCSTQVTKRAVAGATTCL